MRSDKVKKLTLSAVFVSLSVLLCVFASFFPTLSLCIIAVSGIASAILLIHCGYKYSILAFLASAVLVFLLAPDKECAAYYIILFGHYPALKTFTERVTNRVAVWAVKIAEANVLFAILFAVSTYILGIYDAVGKSEILITALAFNAAFILYDICLGKIMFLYISKYLQNGRFH